MNSFFLTNPLLCRIYLQTSARLRCCNLSSMGPSAGVEGRPPLAIQQAPPAAGGPSSGLPQHPAAWPGEAPASHGLPGHGHRQSGHLPRPARGWRRPVAAVQGWFNVRCAAMITASKSGFNRVLLYRLMWHCISSYDERFSYLADLCCLCTTDDIDRTD